MVRKMIETEIQRRAERQLRQTRLVADYYRIRRRLAWPLPVVSLSAPRVALSGRYDTQQYPWAIWMLWALEERIASLGWAGQWLDDAACRDAACVDLAALADWPDYRGGDRADLPFGHAARCMVSACREWEWLGDELRAALAAAMVRMVDDALPRFRETYAAFNSPEDYLSADRLPGQLHNIPLIGAMGMAMAASTVGHDAAGELNARLDAALTAWLAVRERGVTEAVAYDGYVHDFMIPWLTAQGDAGRRERLARHPQLDRLLDESAMLSAPGAMMEVAELSDVEPRHMPFHASAHARRCAIRPSAALAWYLLRCDVSLMPADGLAAIHGALDSLVPLADASAAPACPAMDAHYALVLRTGWDAPDLSVAAACSASPFGHVHDDNGSVVIGTAGRWLLADPGYQQYLKASEREFTLGASAHNAPVINGVAQTRKAPRRLALAGQGADGHLAIELADCYETDAKLKTVARHVWLAGRGLVVVADRIEGEGVRSARWQWHGHPEAAWWIEDNWATIYLDGSTLSFTSPGAMIGPAHLDRLRGSRGHLTLSLDVLSPPPVTWWVFALAPDHPTITPADAGQALTVAGQTFRL